MLLRVLLGWMLAFTPALMWAQAASPFACGVWSGNVTPAGASVVVRLKASGAAVRLQVSENPTLLPAIYSATGIPEADAGNALTLTVQSLRSDTDYYYGIEIGGELRTDPESRGRFHTFPAGRSSFKIAFASCSDFRKADQRVFDTLIAEHPLLFIHMGDLHYIDTDSTNVDEYRRNYDSVLNHPKQAAFYRTVPIAYMWDDHDFCGDTSDTTAIGRDTARAAYRERVPHYPIATAGGAVAQAFTIGRVRVILTDLRSATVSPSEAESATKSHMGAAQKAWFKQELLNARDAAAPLTLWVCTHGWIGAAAGGVDAWAGYATERTEIANFIRDNNINNVVLLAGDMHGLAFDDGTHSDYATGGGAPLKVLHAASLTTDGEIKGGPYTAGPFLGPQQYGVLEVIDDGGSNVTCRFVGKKAGEFDRLNYAFTSPAAQTGPALINISMLAHLNRGDDTLTSGFVIAGQRARRVMMRAVGPSLAGFGVTDALERPVLSVFQGGERIATNDGWSLGRDPAVTMNELFDRVGAFRLATDASRDAALVLTLNPGAYTAQVKSSDGQAGAALLEVYDVP
jgi:phosphodiesterase/alkaline phosphatase D-like protein